MNDANIIIRRLEEKDVEPTSEVLVRAFKSVLGDRFDVFTARHFSPEMLREDLTGKDKYQLSETRIFVAEEQGRIVGAVKVTANINGLGVFDYVGVDPECHSHGVGSLLMRAAEAFWNEHRQRKITTCVLAHNKKALLYYLKNDFIPEGYCRDHFQDGMDEIILGRFLKR